MVPVRMELMAVQTETDLTLKYEKAMMPIRATHNAVWAVTYIKYKNCK
jgi:hypothetical protein